MQAYKCNLTGYAENRNSVTYLIGVALEISDVETFTPCIARVFPVLISVTYLKVRKIISSS